MDREGESACIGVEFREDSRNGCRIGLVGHENAILNECVWGRGEGGFRFGRENGTWLLLVPRFRESGQSPA